MIGSRTEALNEMYRMSVSIAGGRAASLVDRFMTCSGRDFRSAIRSDFKEVSESFRPVRN